MQGLDLERDLTLDVFEAEFAGGGVTGFYYVEEVAVGVVVEEGERGCLLPVREKVGVEFSTWIAFDSWKGGVVLEIEVVFYA